MDCKSLGKIVCKQYYAYKHKIPNNGYCSNIISIGKYITWQILEPPTLIATMIAKQDINLTISQIPN